LVEIRNCRIACCTGVAPGKLSPSEAEARSGDPLSGVQKSGPESLAMQYWI
jgi:hypothetical protein